MNWLYKFYSFYMAAVVVIGDGHGLIIEAHRKNQPNKCKLLLCALLFYFNISFKRLYIRNKMELFSYKGGWGGHGRMCIMVFKRRADVGYIYING